VAKADEGGADEEGDGDNNSEFNIDKDEEEGAALHQERIQTAEKLRRVVDIIQEFGWSVRQFLLACAGSGRGGIGIELMADKHRAYRTIKQRREILQATVLEDACGSATSLVFEEAKRELASLMKQ
jgi:hypothetical protein